MQQALTAPVVGSIVLGGLLGVAAVLGGGSDCEQKRLVLHAVDEPNAIYLTAFRDKQLTMSFEDGELRPMRFEMRAAVFGCDLLAIETLVPIDEKSFSYDYKEFIFGCADGVLPPLKTPRTGLVTVAD